MDQIEEVTRWSKFILLHGISLDTSMKAITTSLQSNHSELTLTQTP